MAGGRGSTSRDSRPRSAEHEQRPRVRQLRPRPARLLERSQRALPHLFFVLEPDAWGNFILTGYDYGSAWDWARFGLLHLHDGVFEGDRVLPEGWVDFISTPAPGDPSGGYGGLFWLNRGGAMDRVPEDAYWPAGFMGQLTVVIPSRDMVVVRLGPSPGNHIAYINETIGRVLDAVNPRRAPN